MQELTPTEIYHLTHSKRFPNIELSYETIPHMKVSPEYNLVISIPIGIKCYAWITFYGSNDVCFIMELNKDKKISKITYSYIDQGDIYANGTLFYGTAINSRDFIIEDILMYKGILANKSLMSEKLGFMYSFMREYKPDYTRFYMPFIYFHNSATPLDGSYNVSPDCKYPIHHLQYRALNKISPYLNIYSTKKSLKTTMPILDILVPYRYANFSKPQYKQPTIFKITADFQFDIYHLFAYGSNKSQVYYNVAYIPSYKSSVFMNKLFRNIKENANLDTIEESDDEDDFENIDPEKYVDLKKELLIECKFHPKFKKWIPQRVVASNQKVVHISQL